MATKKKTFTPKQKLFIAAYFECGLNATEAAALAGYKGNRVTLATIGYENLRKPQIKAEIDRRLEEMAMGKDEVLYRLADQARGSLGDFLNGAAISIEQAAERGKLHLVKEYSRTVTRKDEDVITETVKLKLHDAQAALVQIGRAHKLFTDRTETEVNVNSVQFYLPDNGRGDAPEQGETDE